MCKALILFLSALSIAYITTAENTCKSAVNPVPVFLPGPAGPAGPPGEKGDSGSQPGGAVYTQWGRTTCPPGATLVYASRAAGAEHFVDGGTSDTLCMPETPQYLSIDNTTSHVSRLYGVEFETKGDASAPFSDLHENNMPYAVCHTNTKLALLTIPAQYNCPGGWSMEYNGYLMTGVEDYGHERKDTICVDKDAEVIPGLEADKDDAVVYLMRATCEGLPCPPYNNGMVLACVVCSK